MTTNTLTLPSHAIVPDPGWDYAKARLQAVVWERAQTLFLPCDDSSVPDRGYRIESYAYGREPNADLFLIYKPRPEESNGDYTEGRYIYNARHQTCSCPFFCGLSPQHWSDAFTVTREGSRIVIRDRDGREVPPDKVEHGYCKHHLGALLLFANRDTASQWGVVAPQRRTDSLVPNDRDF